MFKIKIKPSERMDTSLGINKKRSEEIGDMVIKLVRDPYIKTQTGKYQELIKQLNTDKLEEIVFAIGAFESTNGTYERMVEDSMKDKLQGLQNLVEALKAEGIGGPFHVEDNSGSKH